MKKRPSNEQALGVDYLGKALVHYASPYYDPVKAHEYYMRTRELKKRKAATALTSTKQRNVFAVAKDSIAKEKQAAVEKTVSDTQAHVEQLRAKAEEAVARINKNLQDIAAQIKDKYTSTQLNKIPPSASPAQKAFLQRENAKIMARARNTASKDLTSASRQASRERAQLSNSLRNEISKARESYKEAMTALNEKYKKILETEQANIRKKVPGAPAKKKK